MGVILRAAGAAVLAVTLAAAPAAAQAAGARIGFVRTSVVFDSAPGRAAASTAFEREAAGYQAQVQRMSDSLNAMVGSYREAAAGLTPAQQETRQRAIQAKQEEYEQRAQQIDQEVAQRREALMRPLLEQIRATIEVIRAEDGLALVMSADAGSPVVAYDTNLDITDRVIARLKVLGPPRAAAAPATAPAGPASTPSGVTRPRTP